MNKILCIAILLSMLLGSGKMPMNATVGISIDKDIFSVGKPVVVHVTISNPNNVPIQILKWFTPIEGVEQPLFIVARNGEPVPYLGAMVKRPVPTEQDYITLAAGERITSDVNLSAFYDFSIAGNYEIIYDVASSQLYPHSRRLARLVSNILSIFRE